MSVGIIARALSSDWAHLSEEMGLWIPLEVINKEHDDKPEGEEEFGNNFLILFLTLSRLLNNLYPLSCIERIS